jgi:photosystem II stability/assembly factor-like uncharacterized protein
MRALPLAVALLWASLSPAASAPAADDIVNHYVEARGGAAKLKALQSVRFTGKLVFSHGPNFAFHTRWAEVIQRPGSVREESTVQGLTKVDAFDGTDAWTVFPFQGRREAERASADTARDLAQDADIEGPLFRWKEKGHQVEYMGTEETDGSAAHKLRVQLKDGDTLYVFLDPSYFLPIKEVIHRHARGVERVEETDFGSYQQVGGVWFPFSIATGPQGHPRNVRITVERGDANVAVDPAMFHFPAGAKSVPPVLPLASEGESGPMAQAPAPLNPTAPQFDSSVISGLGARNIGSAQMSGRVAAVAARSDHGKTTLYVGAASGGVWRSEDDGTTFKPVFDKQTVQSIGAITIDPVDPNTVWVGTGESWTRNSASIGDGIYRSTDRGDTWTRMGLPKSERISRILVNPKNHAVVFACVPGAMWSDSDDRGLYRTSDGGRTWERVLAGKNGSTGCGGAAMDPSNPDVIFASLWDFRRKGWTFRSGGDGPDKPSGSGLFRSSDGGKTWSELTDGTTQGIPAKPWGRVEVAIAPSDAKVVYALIESPASALYRSSDGGKTWERRDNSQMMVWRPFYFARLAVDPTNPDRIFKPDLNLVVSDDGGRSFAFAGGQAHGDWHDIWIDPTNAKHVIGGDDGGLWLSWDGGNRWWKSGNLPIAQFYHVAVDAKDPYQVYGGLQDNSSWVGDSDYPGGITNQRWENLYDGDGFWTLPDPSDPDAVYAEAQGGYIGRVNRVTHTTRNIQPQANYREKLRYNWNTPIAVSPTNKKTLYLGAQFLFRSRDRGDTWERISPDLTTNNPEEQKQEESGGVTVDNSSAEMHTTIFSISESPRDEQVIWVGTDDGNVQVTRDGGKTWTNVVGNVKDLPPESWVNWVEASRYHVGTAYAAFDRHTFGDMTPWVYRTTDFGRSWQRIAGLEQGVRGYAHVIKEDLVKPGLLFLGTELGLWISVDGGKQWAEFKGGGFPSVAVRDLQIQSRDDDLVLATHGRGIWIVDDIRPLRALTSDVLAKDLAFLTTRPIQERMPAHGGWSEGDAVFVGESANSAAEITYYQRDRHLFGPMSIQILDSAGNEIDTVTPTQHPGLNRVTWAMRLKPPKVPRAATVAFGAARGPRVPPGTYTVRLTRGTTTSDEPLALGLDRRAPYTVADRKQQYAAAMRVYGLFEDMSGLVDRIQAAGGTASARASALPSGDALTGKLRAASDRLDQLRKKIVATKEGGAITGEERIREHADTLYNGLMEWEGRPSRNQLERIDVLKRELDDVRHELDGPVATDLRTLNAELEQRKLGPIPVGASTGTAGARTEARDLPRCLGIWCAPESEPAMPAETE